MKSTIFAVFLSACAVSAIGCSAESSEPNPGGTGGTESAERTPIGKADSLSGSCAEGDVCGGKSKGSCWCDAECSKYGDCCADYESACGGGSGGCTEDSECGSGKTCTEGACVVVDGRCTSAADCGDSESCISPACEPGGPCPAGYCVGSATISFDSSFDESVSGKLVAGGKVAIHYDEDRLTKCRGDQGGNPAWTIYGYYQLNGGTKKPFWVAGHSSTGQTDTPVIVPSEPGELVLWFENTNMWGCIAYDSNMGQNYRFEVAPLGG